MRDLRPLPAACLFAATLAAGAVAQPVDPARAVDPNVGDRGPNAASLRYVDPGNAQHSFAARLTTTDFRSAWSPFRAAHSAATDPATGLPYAQSYQYAAPGVRALMDRPDYLVNVGGRVPGRNVQPVVDGQQALIIPANTVFQLVPERPRAQAPEPVPVAANYLDLRFSPRPVQSTPLHNPVSFSIDGRPGTPGTPAAALEVDASQLRFPAAALAAQPTDIPTPDTPALPEPPAEPDATAAPAEDTPPAESTTE